MEIKRTIEISVEKTRRFVIRQPETDAVFLCPACSELMLTAEASAVLFQIKCRRVYQIIETGAAHFFETEAGALFVCPSSLDRAIVDVNEAPSAEVFDLLAETTAGSRAEETEIRQRL